MLQNIRIRDKGVLMSITCTTMEQIFWGSKCHTTDTILLYEGSFVEKVSIKTHILRTFILIVSSPWTTNKDLNCVTAREFQSGGAKLVYRA